MALDPRIILGVQPLDVVGAMRQGNAAAAETNQIQQQNALADLYRTQGAGIIAGNQQSLNALAQMDPTAALNIQSTRQDMTYKTRQLEVLNEQEKRALEKYKAGKTAAELAADAKKIEAAVKVGLALPNASAWDQYMSANSPDLVGQFDNKQALAQRFMTIAEIIKQNESPAWRVATKEEAAGYGAAGGQINDKTGEFKPINPPSTMSVRTNPDGTTTLVQGPGAEKAFTEAQGKDNVFATRATGALAKLEQPINPNKPDAGVMADSLSVLRDSALDRVPLVGNYLTTDNFQVARTAADEFLQAILRKDTGAAITPAEQDLYGTTYLPQPGDSKPRLDYKREARARAVAALKSGMSQAQLESVARADKAALEQIGGGDTSTPSAAESNIPADAIQLLRQNDSPDYRKMFDEVFGQGAAARALGGN